ncbi:MAG: NUMOD3 domain-containing DNA-binding protein [Candidatus Nealsonbacteria bacterium]|nr:NUMOD3 domain-containing DNA-binding protein [Candidatus Nealsonbacteria bacterium]
MAGIDATSSRGKTVEVICKGCGIPFQAKESLIKIGKGRFHSSSCANKFHSGKNSSVCKTVEVICKNCNEPFNTTEGRIKAGKGKYCSKKCFSESQKGKIISEELRQRMSLSHRGKRQSRTDETKRRISESNKGRICSKETREKISKTLTKEKIKRKCGFCGKPIEVRLSKFKEGKENYCNFDCASKDRGLKKRNGKFIKCQVCGKEKYFPLALLKNGKGKYDTEECRRIGISRSGSMSGENNPHWNGGKIKKICIVCNKDYETYHERSRHCSHRCFEINHGIEQRGENSHLWKGGITQDIKKYSLSFIYTFVGYK